MKKHAKILFKEFGSSFGRFIAIAGIIALGVAFLIGLTAATPDIKMSFTDYFNESRLSDCSIRGEGFGDEDVEKVKAVDGIKEAVALYTTDALCDANDKPIAVRFYGLGNDWFDENKSVINKLTLTSGRMPTKPGEAVAVVPFGSMEEVSDGDYITVSEEDRDLKVEVEVEIFGRPQKFNIDLPVFDDNYDYKFAVVGAITTPLYFSVNDETCTKGDGKVDAILFTFEDSFDTEGLSYGTLGSIAYPKTEMWAEGENSAKYTAFTPAYEDYAKSITDEIEKIDDEWYVLGRDTNLSYYSMSINADKVANIAGIFPVFFIIVAALVAFSTIVRMVDEDRAQIGALRSLGYSGARITGKYIFYALAACGLGLIAAVPLGLTILPIVIFNAYGSMYMLPALKFTADWLTIALCLVISLAATLLVTLLACRASLKETPASILQPRSPKPGKRILLERFGPLWRILPFKYKATMRNIFRFKRNFIMTVLAVAGCSALIVAGFGMMNSTSAVTDLQFNRIYNFDLTIGVSQDYKESELTESGGFLENKEYIEVLKERGSAISGDVSENANIVAAGKELNDYIDLGGAFNENAVMISKGLADALGTYEGDEVTVRNASGEEGTFGITHVVTMYSECWLFVGKTEYADVFGDASFDSLLVKSGVDEADQSEISEKLYKIDCVNSVSFTSSEKVMFDNLSETLTLIVLVLIICAGALVVIVLYNLTNINIGERKKEIATLKVLGYKMSEVAGYVFREIAILVLIGILVGFGLGYGLLFFILGSVNAPYLTFPIIIYWWSFLVAAGITLLFSGLVDLILLPKLGKIDMAESMKAVD